MYISQVVDTQTGITYNLERLLGSGATAQVWYGIPELGAHNSAPMAVKVAFQGTLPEELAAFEYELKLPSILAAHGAEHALPHMSRGHAFAAPEAFCVVMELIPDSWQLSQIAAQAGGYLPERLALQSGLQFAQLLQALHAAKITMRGDRKATDFRWDEEHERLVVIDWNRAAAIPPEVGPAVREDLLLQDIRVFGQIWAELVLGRAVAELPPTNDTSDLAWSCLSRGLRAILSRALSHRVGASYGAALPLKEDLAQHLQAFSAFEEGKIDELALQAEKMRAQTEWGSPSERTHWVHRALNLCDLVLRATDAPAVVARVEPIVTWGEAQLASIDVLAGQVIARICEALDLDGYREAARLANEAIGNLTDYGPTARAAILRLMRWRALAAVGLAGNEHGKNMSEVVPLLRRIIEEVERLCSEASGNITIAQKLEQAELHLNDIFASLPELVLKPMLPLRIEIGLRRQLDSSLRAREAGDAPTANDAEVQTRTLWRELNALDDIYADHLRNTLLGVAELLLREQREIESTQSAAQVQDELQQAYNDLLQALNQPEPIWPAIDQPLAKAWQALAFLEKFGSGEPATPRAKQLVTLRKINDLVAQHDLVRALEIAHDQPEDALFSVVRARLVQVARSHIKQLLGAENRNVTLWIDEIEQAERLMAATNNGFLGASSRTALANELQQLRANYDRMSAVVADFLQQPALLLTPAIDSNQHILDDILDEADAARIELLDRRNLPHKEIERYRVANIKRLRALHRATTYHTTHMAELAKLISGIAQDLSNQAENLEQSHQRLAELLDQQREYAASGQLQQFSRFVEKLRRELDDFERLTSKRLTDAEFAALEASIRQRESRLRDLSIQAIATASPYNNAEKQVKALANAEASLALSLYSKWCTLSMHAANVFNFNLAINYHSHLKAWQHAAGVAMDDERAKIIDQTISELQWLKEQHPLWSFLVDWNKALDTNNPKAIGAWVAKMTDIFRQEPDLLQMSLVDQLRRRHYAQWGEDIMSAPVEPSPAILPSTPLEQKVTRVLSGSRQLDIQQLLFIWNEFIKKADLATDDEFSRWLEITQQGIEALAEDTMDKDWVQLEEKIQKAIKVINAITVNYSNQSKREKYFIWIHQLEAVKTSIHKQRSVKPRV